MGLRERASDEVTLAEYEAAWEDRFQDAIVLVKGGRRLAAIYLLGYVAEIVLKYAFYRLLGYKPEDLIRLGSGGRADDPRGVAHGVLGIPQLRRGLHNPDLWARMIVQLRRQLDLPRAPDLVDGLLNKAEQIDSNWKVSLRYNRECSTLADFRALWKAVAWVKTHADQFWR